MTVVGVSLIAVLLGLPQETSADPFAKQREALQAWTNEPVALEEQHFLLHMDRRDSSLFFQDRRTGVKWFSAWGRRGFATVELADEKSTKLPVDVVDGLVTQSKRLRFRGKSKAGELPPITFKLETHASSRGVTISYEVAEKDAGKVASVTLLDGALWIADAEKGGYAVPDGMGEWLEAEAIAAGTKTFAGLGPAAPAGTHPYSIPLVGLFKGENPVLVSWSDSTAVLAIEGDPAVAGESFPGKKKLALSLTFRGSKGQVSVFALGKEQGGVLDATRNYRDLLGPEFFQQTLRFKTGSKPELRTLLGAALLRVALDEDRTLKDISDLAVRLKSKLEIAEAAVLVAGWHAGPDLDACSKAVKEKGYLFGLEWDAVTLPAEKEKRQELFLPLAEGCAPQFVVVSAPEIWPAVSRGEECISQRAEMLRSVRDTFGLVGITGGSSVDIEPSAILMGPLSVSLKNPNAPRSWPVFTSAFGHCARITARSEDAVRPDQPEAVLVHLLAGEVPLYALPLKGAAPLLPASDPRRVFTRDDGWAAGKELTPHEVFLKTTYEILSQVARQHYRDVLFYHRKLNPAGTARETYFGTDLRIVVNFGPGDYEDEEEGFLLPPYGFFVRYPMFRAFHAKRMNDLTYDSPACFLMYSLEGKMILRADEVKVFHFFGPDTVQFGGRSFQVPRDAVVKFQ